MKADAEAHADEDKKKRELVDARNKADHFVYTTKKSLEEHGDKVSEDVKGKIETAITGVEEAIKGEDVEAINTAVDTLAKESQELGKAVYEAEQAKSSAPGNEASDTEAASADEDVIDADYEVKS